MCSSKSKFDGLTSSAIKIENAGQNKFDGLTSSAIKMENPGQSKFDGLTSSAIKMENQTQRNILQKMPNLNPFLHKTIKRPSFQKLTFIRFI